MTVNRTLIRTAFGLWAGAGGLYLAYYERYQYQFRNSEFVKESLRVLKDYPHAESLLGENIKQLRFDLGDDFIRKDDRYAQMVVPVVGSKMKGKVYCWTSRQTQDDSQKEYWRVDRADLMLHGHDPFTFFKRPEAEYVNKVKLEEENLRREYKYF